MKALRRIRGRADRVAQRLVSRGVTVGVPMKLDGLDCLVYVRARSELEADTYGLREFAEAHPGAVAIECRALVAVIPDGTARRLDLEDINLNDVVAALPAPASSDNGRAA